MSRFDIERAVQRAGLPAPSIAVMMALCTTISARSGRIEARYSPSLHSLARMTGLDVSTVCRHLAALEAGGWVTRERPERAEAGREHKTTLYALAVPDCPQPSRTRRKAPPAEPDTASGAPPEGPAAQGKGGLSQAASQSSRDTEGTRVGVIDDGDIAVAREELTALTGRPVSRAVAAEAARLVLGGRTDIIRRAAYLRRSLRADPQRFIPRRGPVPYAELAAEQAAAIARGNAQEGITHDTPHDV